MVMSAFTGSARTVTGTWTMESWPTVMKRTTRSRVCFPLPCTVSGCSPWMGWAVADPARSRTTWWHSVRVSTCARFQCSGKFACEFECGALVGLAHFIYCREHKLRFVLIFSSVSNALFFFFWRPCRKFIFKDKEQQFFFAFRLIF
jgi:hypothetical protein